MTFETNQVAGTANILEKLVGLPFQKVVHKLSTLDAQPAGESGQILVHVTGQLLVCVLALSPVVIMDFMDFASRISFDEVESGWNVDVLTSLRPID